jgi:hypothetical protein
MRRYRSAGTLLATLVLAACATSPGDSDALVDRRDNNDLVWWRLSGAPEGRDPHDDATHTSCWPLRTAGHHRPPSGRTTFTETFQGGNNTGGWTLGNPFLETIETTGGKPGAYLHFPDLDTFAPQPTTTLPDSPFTGDYRSRSVTSVGIDLVLHHVDFSSAERPLAVLLTNDGRTPEDFSDDCTVYFLGNKNAPMPNSVWRGYRFKVPSDSTELPRGWNVLFCGELSNDEAWNYVIGSVTELRFFVGDPTFFFIFQVWDIGMDNPTITSGTPEPEDELLYEEPFESPNGDVVNAPRMPGVAK